MHVKKVSLAEVAGQVAAGMVAMAIVCGIMLLFAMSYYQAIGRVDWTHLLGQRSSIYVPADSYERPPTVACDFWPAVDAFSRNQW